MDKRDFKYWERVGKGSILRVTDIESLRRSMAVGCSLCGVEYEVADIYHAGDYIIFRLRTSAGDKREIEIRKDSADILSTDVEMIKLVKTAFWQRRDVSREIEIRKDSADILSTDVEMIKLVKTAFWQRRDVSEELKRIGKYIIYGILSILAGLMIESLLAAVVIGIMFKNCDDNISQQIIILKSFILAGTSLIFLFGIVHYFVTGRKLKN